MTFAVHPASHNCPTDSKLCVVISGTICVSVAAGGSPAMLMCPSCVDVITLPSGIVICMGFFVSTILMRLLLSVARCVVHPVSMMVGSAMLLGGPKSSVVMFLFNISLKLFLGSPPCQSVVVAAVPVRWIRFFPNFISLHPACILNHVASLTCPSLGYLHLALVCCGFKFPPCDQQ